MDLLASAGLLFSEAMEAPCRGGEGDKEEIRPLHSVWLGKWCFKQRDKQVWAPLLLLLLLPLQLQQTMPTLVEKYRSGARTSFHAHHIIYYIIYFPIFCFFYTRIYTTQQHKLAASPSPSRGVRRHRAPGPDPVNLTSPSPP